MSSLLTTCLRAANDEGSNNRARSTRPETYHYFLPIYGDILRAGVDPRGGWLLLVECVVLDATEEGRLPYAQLAQKDYPVRSAPG